MALLICPECASTLSEHAIGCPTCGCPMDKIIEMASNKEQVLLDYKETMENLIRESASDYWNARCSLMKDEDVRYEKRLKELEESEQSLIPHVAKTREAIAEYNHQIEELSATLNSLGFMKNKRRNQLQSEIDDINIKCRSLLSQIEQKHKELESLKSDNDYEHRKKYREIHPTLINQYYVSEMADDHVRLWEYCRSVEDVIKLTLKSERYTIFSIRDLLEIGSPLSREQLYSLLPFSDGEYKYTVRSQITSILCDSKKSMFARISKIQLAGDDYYTYMSNAEYEQTLTETMSILDNNEMRSIISEQKNMNAYYTSHAEKPAGVIKRAALGWIVAGPAGAIIGGLSAVDKNNRNK